MRFFIWLRCFCLAVFFLHMGNKYFYSSANGIQCNGKIDESVLQKTNLMMAGVDLDLGGVFITTSDGTYHEHVEDRVSSPRNYIALFIRKDLTVDALYSLNETLFGKKFKHIDGIKWNESEILLEESVRKTPVKHIFADEDGKYYAYESSNGRAQCQPLMEKAIKGCKETAWMVGKGLAYDEFRGKMNNFNDKEIYSVIACNKYSEVDGLLKVSSKGYKDKFYCKNSSWKYVQLVDKTWAVERSNCRTIKFNAITQGENFTTNSQESTFSPAVSTLSSHTQDWSISLFTILPTVPSNVTSSTATASTATASTVTASTTAASTATASTATASTATSSTPTSSTATASTAIWSTPAVSTATASTATAPTTTASTATAPTTTASTATSSAPAVSISTSSLHILTPSSFTVRSTSSSVEPAFNHSTETTTSSTPSSLTVSSPIFSPSVKPVVPSVEPSITDSNRGSRIVYIVALALSLVVASVSGLIILLVYSGKILAAGGAISTDAAGKPRGNGDIDSSQDPVLG